MDSINVFEDPRESSPLHRAAADGDLEAIDELARDAAALDLPGALQMTPLYTAIGAHQEAAALRLIELGADVNKANVIGSSPLIAAALIDSARIIEALLDHGAELEYELSFQGKVMPGQTALMLAAKEGKTAAVRALLERGANAAVRNAGGQTPLSLAAEKGHAEIVSMLAAKNIEHRAAKGWTSEPGPPGEPDSAEPDDEITEEFVVSFEAQLASRTPEQRLTSLTVGIVQAGSAFINTLRSIAEHSPEGSLTREQYQHALLLMTHWMTGARLTDRADEAERRLLTLQSAIDRAGDRAADLMPAYARSILQLPEDHPRRDVGFALERLFEHVARCADRDASADLVKAAIAIVKHSGPVAGAVSPDAVAGIVDLAESKIDEVQPDDVITLERLLADPAAEEESPATRAASVRTSLRRDLRSHAAIYFASNALHAKETGDPDRQKLSTERAREQMRLLDELEERAGEEGATVQALLAMAVLEEMDERLGPAADAYAKAAALGGAGARQQEGRLRLRLGEYTRAVEVLAPALPEARARYLNALEGARVESAADGLAAVSTMLAFSLALTDRWDEALQALDQGKSLRLRHRLAMRSSEAGRRVLEIEAALYDIERGIEPPASTRPQWEVVDMQQDQVLRESLYLEEYRMVRPTIPDDLVESPGVGGLAASLDAGEGVVVIGTSFVGTMLALIVPGDTAAPAQTRLLEDLTRARLFELCQRWRAVLSAPEGYKKATHRDALQELLPKLDAALGEPIRDLVGERELSRLTIVPHLWLHGVPFWALASLGSFTVALAPSAGQFVAARKRAAIPRRAVAVGDPTLDLPMSRMEAGSVGKRLAGVGFGVEVVIGRQATEERVAGALADAGLLHFCGHGRSDMLVPSRSALLLHPAGLPDQGHPIETALAAVGQWDHSAREGRFASLPGGQRIYEIKFPEAGAREYFLERGPLGTLWARYQGADCVAMAELWRAGDISAAGQFAACGIAFLSACEVGTGALGSIYRQSVDEYGGIPGALQLAGVPCVVASLWPVADELALVYVELFYAELVGAKDRIDVAAIAKRVAGRIRTLGGAEAAEILTKLSAQSQDLQLQFRLEATAHRVGAEPRPFEDPIHWAAFFVTGASEFALL